MLLVDSTGEGERSGELPNRTLGDPVLGSVGIRLHSDSPLSWSSVRIGAGHDRLVFNYGPVVAIGFILRKLLLLSLTLD